jgi:hypothetical protein
MGKAALLITGVAFVSVLIIYQQTSRVELKIDREQAARQELILSREVARSGFSAIRSKIELIQIEHPGVSVPGILELIPEPLTGTIHGGSYEAWMEKRSASSYAVYSRGTHGEAASELSSFLHDPASGIVTKPTLESPGDVEIIVEVIESDSESCSALFVDVFKPGVKNNHGHGNNEDGVDCSNPGEGWWRNKEDLSPGVDDEKDGYFLPCEPLLVFKPGTARAGDEVWAYLDVDIPSGWYVNFILAVDADEGCEMHDQEIGIDDPSIDYLLYALATSNNGYNADVKEGPNALIQQHPNGTRTWRVAFENKRTFSKFQLADVKLKGYGSRTWNMGQKTYGGSGWSDEDSRGYWRLVEQGHMPDFKDFVMEVEMVPLPSALAASESD